MKTNNKFKKFLTTQILILNLIVGIFIIREIIKFYNLKAIEKDLNDLQQTIDESQDNNKKINELNQKYDSLIKDFAFQNTLGDLIKITQEKIKKYNLEILQTKVLSVTEEQIEVEISVTGNLDNIASFIKSFENSIFIKEIYNTEIKLVDQKPQVKMVIKSYKL